MKDAIEHWRQAVRASPTDATAYYNLGHYLARARCYSEAIKHLETACTLMSTEPRVYNALGYVLNKQGRNAEAIACFRQALRLDPGFIAAHDNLVYYLHYEYDCSPEDMLHEHAVWNKRHAIHIRPVGESCNAVEQEKVIKVGYVSADFRTHSVARFLEPLLSNHDSNSIEVYCYADIEQADRITERLASYATHWRVVRELGDYDLARQVYADNIDILVDLAGHTSNNRLLVFARKPAPVQVSWLGYPDTTGMTSIDYRITDAWTDPPGETNDCYSEKLIHLPNGFLCYRPPAESEPVTSLPMINNKVTTFGSFNALPKVTPRVVRLWASILASVPNSRLIMKNKSFMDPGTQQRYRTLFMEHGIDPNRIDLLGWVSGVNAHMALYGRIDIGLDTFPYNGTTTTCESLWMGVPVLTLRGRTHVERVGASLLSRIGMYDWISESQEQYLDKAVEYAKNSRQLVTLRKEMRSRMQASTLCDGPGFARDMEQAYRFMWTEWCNRQ
jgi:predicted O-linked N-acetylglucosamine transferase (SPINDLY family)